MRVLAMGLAVLMAVGAARADALFDAELQSCKSLTAIDREQARECLEKLRAKLEEKMAIRNAGQAFMARFGISDPDAQAKYLVANRKGLIFARILETCSLAEILEPDAARFRACLDQHEKAEKMMGNRLDQPDRLPGRLR